MSASPKLTPMFEQYFRMKEEYPDALLFFRMGDFYEMFYEDAEVAARELQIALTSRNPRDEFPVPMCGVPHHAAESYLAQLMEKGFKVAVCEQMEDPRQAKGLVKRAVTRVLTPGTVVEDSNLPSASNNYLAALWWETGKSGGSGGVAWVDFSTGEWTGLATRKEPELWQWLAKMEPRELLLPDTLAIPPHYADLRAQVNRVPAGAFFDLAGARAKILAAQNVAQLSVLDLEDKPELVRAMGALLVYLLQTQKAGVGTLRPFTPITQADHLHLDEVTQRNLELFRTLDGRTGKGTLRHVLGRTLTPMGGRRQDDLLRRPWRDVSDIRAEQASVARLADDDALRERLRAHLDAVFDLERLITRIALNRTTPRDFAALRQSVAALPGLRALLQEADAAEPLPARFQAVAQGFDDLSDLAELLERALVDNPPLVVTEGGLFRAGYDSDLDELLELSERGEARLAALLEEEQKANDLPKLKLGYNKVFGWYFELTRAANKGEVPPHFSRRQTLADRERYVTPALAELEAKLQHASERRRSLEYELFQRLREQVAGVRPRVIATAERVARLDVWQSLAAVARAADWVRPEVAEELAVTIRAGRHPVVEAACGGNFVPNDLRMDEDARLLLITGPNMAGKSTVLRQSAIIFILAQMGSYVPAAEARLGVADRIFSRVGASDNLAQGQSTFMVEMTETARILRQATRRSFVILDEIGRGTSTFDGLALAWAVAEDLSDRAGGSVRTLFATHYHELTTLEGRIAGARNFNIAVKEYKGDIVFLRRLVPGPADRSYGIEVAKLAGVPRDVVARAREVLAELERAREGASGAASAVVSARQTLLPGLFAAPQPPRSCGEGETAEHPVLGALREISVERLTPLQALSMLDELKRRLAAEDAK